MKKCILYVLSFAVLSIALFIGSSAETNAMVGFTPGSTYLFPCSEYTGSVTNFPRLRNAWQEMNDEQPFDLENENASYFAYATYPDLNNSGTVTMFYVPNKNDGQLFFTQVGSNLHLAFPANTAGARTYLYSKSSQNINVHENENIKTTVPSQMQSMPSATVGISEPWGNDEYSYYYSTTGHQLPVNTELPRHCIVAWQNIVFDETVSEESKDEFPFDIVESSEIVEIPNKECNVFNFGCWLTELWESVGETFRDVFEATTKFLTWLFVPTEALKTTFDNALEFFQQKLGFLVYPVTLFQDVMNILGAENSGTWQILQNYCFGSIFGNNFCVHLNPINQLLNGIRPILQGLLSVAVVYGFSRKYREVVHK